MSHLVHATVQLQAGRKNAIVSALQAMKIGNIEESETADLCIKDYFGNQTGIKTNIRAKGGYRSDIGFKFEKDGTATLHGDSMFITKSWQDKFIQQYSRAVIREVAAENHYSIASESTEANGDIVLTIETQFV